MIQRLPSELKGSSNPADVFFKILPSPEEFRAATGFLAFIEVAKKVMWLMAAFNSIHHDWKGFRGTNDPEFDQLVKRVFGQASDKSLACFRAFETALAGFALDRLRQGNHDKPADTTATGKLLSY